MQPIDSDYMPFSQNVRATYFEIAPLYEAAFGKLKK